MEYLRLFRSPNLNSGGRPLHVIFSCYSVVCLLTLLPVYILFVVMLCWLHYVHFSTFFFKDSRGEGESRLKISTLLRFLAVGVQMHSQIYFFWKAALIKFFYCSPCIIGIPMSYQVVVSVVIRPPQCVVVWRFATPLASRCFHIWLGSILTIQFFWWVLPLLIVLPTYCNYNLEGVLERRERDFSPLFKFVGFQIFDWAERFSWLLVGDYSLFLDF